MIPLTDNYEEIEIKTIDTDGNIKSFPKFYGVVWFHPYLLEINISHFSKFTVKRVYFAKMICIVMNKCRFTRNFTMMTVGPFCGI